MRQRIKSYFATRRSFLRGGLAAPGIIGAGLIAKSLPAAADFDDRPTHGDINILRFLAALEILETDLWQQYNELGGIQDKEVPGGSRNKPDTDLLSQIDGTLRSERTSTPGLGVNLAPGMPGVLKGKFPAIPRSKDDLTPPAHLQAIVNTAAFHFGTIEQGGSSLYPALAQRVSNVEVLRILLSIGPTETMHFQVWHDKAGNAKPLTDPTNGLTFPNLNVAASNADLPPNLIMPR